MTPARRTVVVGERLLPGYTIDDAINVVTSNRGDLALSVAALDRPDGTSVLAVSVDAGDGSLGEFQMCLAGHLRVVFDDVSIMESDPATLAFDE